MSPAEQLRRELRSGQQVPICDLCEQIGACSEAVVICEACKGVAMCTQCHAATHTDPGAQHKSHRTKAIASHSESSHDSTHLHATESLDKGADAETTRDDNTQPTEQDATVQSSARECTSSSPLPANDDDDRRSRASGPSSPTSPVSPRRARIRALQESSVAPDIVELDRLPFKSEMRPIRSQSVEPCALLCFILFHGHILKAFKTRVSDSVCVYICFYSLTARHSQGVLNTD